MQSRRVWPIAIIAALAFSLVNSAQVGNAEVNNAVMPQGAWVYISAHKTAWFRIGENLRRLTVWVDANHEPRLEMSIYSPEQGDVRSAEPIGHGSRVDGHDLYWSGASRANGAWYVRFDNQNDYSVPYKLMTKTTTNSGVEYTPEVTFAFGTGDDATLVGQATTTQVKPADPVRPLAAPKKPAAAPPPAPPPAPAPVIPGSPDPYNAPEPTGAWVHIAGKTTVWYRVSDRGRRLNIWMDNNHMPGLTMSIYGPDQPDVWGSKPVGRGTPDQGHDFWWTGRARMKGYWRIRITNTTDDPIAYSLNARSVSEKASDMCRDCHGNIVDEWDRCEHSGSFCEDLQEEFRQ